MRRLITTLLFSLFTTLAMAAVDVNKDSQEALESVKGIGPKVAQLIIAEREAKPFANWPDLITRVKGIGSKAAMRFSEGGLTVNKKAYKP